ncbi:MAG: hypothetical protein KF784_11755 [Fimbriimonadaceae bacterium]|nr:hypothetical protein [Fimbriimonadaceae bacterium]
MPIRDALKKAAGLFVEIEGDGPAVSNDPFADLAKTSAPEPKPAPAPAPKTETKTVEQIVKAAPGPNLDEVKVESASVEPVSAPGGQPDFAKIYESANLPPVSFSAEQALELINALPGDLPLEVKRKTVSVSITSMGKALGVTSESVVADASRKLAALSSYTDALSAKTSEYVAATQLQIAAMESEIASKKRGMEEAKRLLEQALSTCNAEGDRLDDVLEFFSLDIPPSKNAKG